MARFSKKAMLEHLEKDLLVLESRLKVVHYSTATDEDSLKEEQNIIATGKYIAKLIKKIKKQEEGFNPIF